MSKSIEEKQIMLLQTLQKKDDDVARAIGRTDMRDKRTAMRNTIRSPENRRSFRKNKLSLDKLRSTLRSLPTVSELKDDGVGGDTRGFNFSLVENTQRPTKKRRSVQEVSMDDEKRIMPVLSPRRRQIPGLRQIPRFRKRPSLDRQRVRSPFNPFRRNNQIGSPIYNVHRGMSPSIVEERLGHTMQVLDEIRDTSDFVPVTPLNDVRKRHREQDKVKLRMMVEAADRHRKRENIARNQLMPGALPDGPPPLFDLGSPALRSPTLRSPTLRSPALRSPALRSPDPLTNILASMNLPTRPTQPKVPFFINKEFQEMDDRARARSDEINRLLRTRMHRKADGNYKKLKEKASRVKKMKKAIQKQQVQDAMENVTEISQDTLSFRSTGDAQPGQIKSGDVVRVKVKRNKRSGSLSKNQPVGAGLLIIVDRITRKKGIEKISGYFIDVNGKRISKTGERATASSRNRKIPTVVANFEVGEFVNSSMSH
jgi:hypothetical protein